LKRFVSIYYLLIIIKLLSIYEEIIKDSWAGKNYEGILALHHLTAPPPPY
jgi:hypothetical protein